MKQSLVRSICILRLKEPTTDHAGACFKITRTQDKKNATLNIDQSICTIEL